MTDVIIDGGTTSQTVVTPSSPTNIYVQDASGTQAIIQTAPPINILVDGTLIGPKGAPSTQITVSPTAPSSPALNDLWIDTSS